MPPRQRLGLISVVALLSLAFLVTLAPIGGVVGAALFVVVLFLVGLLFFRFNPHGDAWDEAQQLGIKPWLYVLRRKQDRNRTASATRRGDCRSERLAESLGPPRSTGGF